MKTKLLTDEIIIDELRDDGVIEDADMTYILEWIDCNSGGNRGWSCTRVCKNKGRISSQVDRSD